jgi:hypothetical protein
MGGILQVDTIQNNNATTLITQTNTTTLTFGVSGQNIVIPSGVTFDTASATVTLPSTINATTINVTTLVLAAGAVGTPSLTTSGDTNTGIFFPAADTIAFTEGGAEAMRIDSSGNVKITSGKKFYADSSSGGTTRTAEIIMYESSSGAIQLKTNNSSTGGIEFFTQGAERMSINTSGALILVGSTAQKATGTTWSNPSDTRLKDNKKNYTKGLNELLQINVKTWEWNGKAGTTQGTTGIGVIADEIEVLLPNTVDTYKAKLNIDDTEETDVKRFDATEITWLLLNSIKEQQAIIEQLKTRLTALESK